MLLRSVGISKRLGAEVAVQNVCCLGGLDSLPGGAGGIMSIAQGLSDVDVFYTHIPNAMFFQEAKMIFFYKKQFVE